MEDLAKEDGKVPKALLDRPEIEEHLHMVWEAFWALSSDRKLGFGAGPIPWSSIKLYADWRGITDADDFDRFHELIRAMDRTFLDHLESKRTKG